MVDSNDIQQTKAIPDLASETIAYYLLDLPPGARDVRSLIELAAQALAEAAWLSEDEGDLHVVFEMSRMRALENLKRRAERLLAKASAAPEASDQVAS
jgi:hypothetical protein